MESKAKSPVNNKKHEPLEPPSYPAPAIQALAVGRGRQKLRQQACYKLPASTTVRAFSDIRLFDQLVIVLL